MQRVKPPSNTTFRHLNNHMNASDRGLIPPRAFREPVYRGHVVARHQSGISHVTGTYFQLSDGYPCRYDHAQQLEYVNGRIVLSTNLLQQPGSHIIVKIERHHTLDPN